MCVHWQIYTVYPNDDMLVDLLTAFGDPFSSSPPLSPCLTSSFAFSPRGCGTVESSPSTTHDCDGGDSGDGGIVRMYIRPHDGQLSHQPIAINHEHTVCPLQWVVALFRLFGTGGGCQKSDDCRNTVHSISRSIQHARISYTLLHAGLSYPTRTGTSIAFIMSNAFSTLLAPHPQ